MTFPYIGNPPAPRLVKPLEWTDPCEANNHTHIAWSPYGHYYVHVDGGRHQAWLEANTKPYEVVVGHEVGNLYEAKAAAQADYAARIFSALAFDPAALIAANADLMAEVGRLTALVDEATPMIRTYRDEALDIGYEIAVLRANAWLRDVDVLTAPTEVKS